MKPGAVIVDVAIDQGGCFETSRPTTHSDPTYVVEGVVHYCVANMPGAVPITSTLALTNVTLPYVEAIADHGFEERRARSSHARARRQRPGGRVTYEPVAEASAIRTCRSPRSWTARRCSECRGPGRPEVHPDTACMRRLLAMLAGTLVVVAAPDPLAQAPTAGGPTQTARDPGQVGPLPARVPMIRHRRGRAGATACSSTAGC